MILQKSYKYAILTEHDDELKNVANDLVLLYHTITSKSRNIENYSNMHISYKNRML